MTDHQNPYDPKKEMKATEEAMARDAIRGIFVTLIIIASAGIGAFLGWYAENSYRAAHPPEIMAAVSGENSAGYAFVNPIVFADGARDDYSEFQPFDNELNAYISSVRKKGGTDSVSVYFRDLNSGHWTGVNEETAYHSAGLSKVAVLMAYLKNSIGDPGILSRKFYYQAIPPVPKAVLDSSSSGEYFPANPLKSGYYSATALIKNMIAYSDADAESTLTAAHPDFIGSLYRDFHFIPNADAASASTSVKQYAAFFRALYNGTYLPANLSEQALALLSMTGWNNGIVAGMRAGIAMDTEYDDAGPADARPTHAAHDDDATFATLVAHMTAEYTERISGADLLGDAIAGRELHDCGIVYFPDKPYLLCIMTKGTDEGALIRVISTISRLTYNYVDGQ